MSLKLIAFDVDGTVITDRRKLLDSSVDAIKLAMTRGCKIIFVTGRPYVSTKPILQKLGLDNRDDEYLALFHGAILQTTSGKILSKRVFSMKDFKDLDLLATDQRVLMVAETPKYIYTTSPNLDLRTAWESYKNRLPIRVRPLGYLSGYKGELNMAKMLYISQTDHLTQVEKNLPSWVRNRFFVARSENYCVDISPKGVNKGWALKQLAERLDIKPSEVMAFGNADNDIPMIDYAGIGVAMKNSSPKLLNKANLITDSNNESGIANAIYKELNQKS